MTSHSFLRAGSVFLGLGLLSLPRAAHGEADVFGTGDGHLGALSVGAKDSVINVYAPVAEAVAGGATAVKIGSSAPAGGAFQAGDLVLLWQAAGLPAPVSGNPTAVDLSTSQVGRWELARVLQIETSGGTVLRLTQPLVTTGGFPASTSQVVKVPEYTTVTLADDANVRALPWNGASGGIVAFLAQGAVTLAATAAVTADGAGFRGGVLQNAAAAFYGCVGYDGIAQFGYAAKGEGVATVDYDAATPVLHGGRGNAANGGGGGDCYNAGGGGGGNGGRGGQGGYTWPGNADFGGSRDVGGLGGAALSYSLASRLSLGGGGGAGEEDSSLGTGGASGGGAILVRAGSLQGAGHVTARGADAKPAATLVIGSDGAGGGGAGGSIVLQFESSASCAEVSAAGGKGGDGNSDCGLGPIGLSVCQSDGPGGGGAGGHILFQARSKACATNVKAGLAGSQASSTWPGGAHRGALPADESDPTAVGVVEEPGDDYCSSNAACSPPRPLCGSASSCRSCTPSDCSGAAPACDQTTGAQQGACVPCTDANTSACTGAKPYCDTATDTCVGCRNSADCSGATPFCDATTRLCRTCTAANDNADCKPSGGVCVTDSNDAKKGQCVQCLSGADCATLSCDLVTHACASCSAGAPCVNPKPVCNSNAVCEPCSTDGQCALRQSGSFCALAAPLTGQCVQCTPTDLSNCNGSAPLCNPTTGTCVACLKDAACGDPHKPLCDLDSMACAPCAADHGAGAHLACPSAAMPACQTSGVLAGTCTECSSSQMSLCTSDRPLCLAASGTCGCAADADCGAPGSGRSCNAGVCVGGLDAGLDAGGHSDGGPDAGGNSDGGSTEAILARGGGFSCGAAGSSWSSAGLALAALFGLARRRKASRRA